FSLRDLFPKWLRHEGKSCPREKNAENPRVVGLLWWSLLSGFAADKMKIGPSSGQAADVHVDVEDC
ncbi:hypothetical protein, partial [Saccharopolyspora sp. NPDC002578]